MLYKKGGHFVAHRDTEKAPGMFATLVIQLPAGHKGGSLVINHKGCTKEFNHENGSRNSFFFTAFFADCEHELRKITKGHRLVLIYNIIQKTTYLNIQTYILIMKCPAVSRLEPTHRVRRWYVIYISLVCYLY